MQNQRMRFFSVPRTVACADKVMLNIIDTYFSPNCTGRERAWRQEEDSYV